jgi:hypothetical protein
MFRDSGLTDPVTGSSYVVSGANAHIYNVNSLTGAVTSDTGLTCSVYPSKNVLSNSSLILCNASFTIYYTPAPFAVGVTLFTDNALTTPVTGFSYVLHSLTGVVYTLNPVSGIIGAVAGDCTPP